MNQKAIVILGMHRSGTSAIMRIVNLLGVDIGDELMGAGTDNPSGFWEHKRVRVLHDRVLKLLNRSWHDIRPFPAKWWEDDEIFEVKKQVIETLKKDFSRSKIWGIKDPRMCRLLPLWDLILDELGPRPYFIHIIRNPREVSDSLKKRNNFSTNKSTLLWLEHVLEAEKGTREYPRVFITYDRLLKDWRLTVDEISEDLDIVWPKKISDVSGEIDSFLNPALRHHDFSDTHVENSENFRMVKTVHDVLTNRSRDKDSRFMETISGVYQEFNKEMHSIIVDTITEELDVKFKPLEDEIKKGEKRIIDLEGLVKKQEDKIRRQGKIIVKRDSTIEMYKNSMSFRIGRVITSPGRWVKKLFTAKR